MIVLCRFVCGEGAGLHSGEAEESCWTVVLGTAGEVSHTFSTTLLLHVFRHVLIFNRVGLDMESFHECMKHHK